MSVNLQSPEGLLQPVPYQYVAVATGTRQVFMAGQVGVDGSHEPVSDDLADQTEAALRNVIRGVEGVGGTPADLVRLTCYVVGWSPDLEGGLMGGIERVQADGGLPDPLPPLTVIGVQALYTPRIRIEIEANAVLD